MNLLDHNRQRNILVLQPWGFEGVEYVRGAAGEHGLSCEIIQVPLAPLQETFFGRILRWYGPSAKVAIRGLRRRKGHSAVLAFDPMSGLIFASLARALGLKHPPMVISGFLLRPWKYRRLDKLRHLFANFGLKETKKIVCFSSFEVDRYKREFPRHADKIVFAPLTARPVRLDIGQEKQMAESNPPKPFIFSGGATNRDYMTLAKAMELIPEVKLLIAGKKKDDPGPGRNLEYRDDLYGLDYERAIFNAKIVVLPLFDKCFSCGQLTLLMAMEMGKAIIASDVPGVRDYLGDHESGVLVPPRDPVAMATAIKELLGDDDWREQLGARARSRYQSRFTQQKSTSKIVDFVAELLEGRQTP